MLATFLYIFLLFIEMQNSRFEKRHRVYMILLQIKCLRCKYPTFGILFVDLYGLVTFVNPGYTGYSHPLL